MRLYRCHVMTKLEKRNIILKSFFSDAKCVYMRSDCVWGEGEKEKKKLLWLWWYIVTTIFLVRAVVTVLVAVALQPIVDASSVRAAKFRSFATCSIHHTHAFFCFFCSAFIPPIDPPPYFYTFFSSLSLKINPPPTSIKKGQKQILKKVQRTILNKLNQCFLNLKYFS